MEPHQPVLLLNANYEPLGVCTIRRAMGLLIVGKAEIVLNGRGLIHTPTRAYPRPSVIRLSYMVHRPRPRVKLSRREVFRRDNYTCQYCGRRTGRLTLDHVIPRHRGGTHSWENLVAACPQCNRRKGGRTLQEAHMRLLRQPFEPAPTALYLYGRYLEENREWEPFLTGW
ncbi:MAG: HNH endonuclease [Chloroflexi bacterium]|nr:MAG: HNH endonuclease [Chloroflexota bacterium]